MSDDLDKLRSRIAALEQELADKIEYYENILSLLPGHVYWLDRQNVYLGCNDEQAQHAGLKSRFDIVNKTNAELPWRKQAVELDRINLEVMETGVPQSATEYARVAEGDRVYFSQKVPLKNNENQTIGLLGISLDITELKKTQNQLAQAKEKAEAANRAKDEFIRNMSHDIRTPLSGIIGMSSILEQEAQNQEEREHAHMVNVSGEQLLTLLNSVLDIIATGSQKENQVNLSQFSIHDLIQNIADLELPTLKLKNLDLRLHLDNSLPDRIQSDQIKIHRILLNILGNAVKFTNQGYIEIGARLIRDSNFLDCIEFYIQDSGIGIAPENLNKIFKKFFRGTSSYQGLYAGHGVGLHIVKQYIQLLQGNIQVESTLGQGTRFVIKIPVTVIKVEDKPAKSIATPKLPELNSSIEPAKALKILLVEDNVIALKTAESILSKQGLQFRSAINGKQAIDLYRNEHFELVLTDIGLPDISGLDVTRQIRQIEQEKQLEAVPVIGLTAHSIQEVEPEGVASGMDQVLTKPIRPDMLRKLINDCHLYNKVQNDSDLVETASISSAENPPLLDTECGISTLGSEDALKELLQLFIDGSRTDANSIQSAWQTGDFAAVQSLAHKMKSSALYCGTIRMRYACEALEHHFKHQVEGQPEKLYHDFCQTVEETIAAAEDWLRSH